MRHLNNKRFAIVFLALLTVIIWPVAGLAAPNVPPKPDRFNYVYDEAGLLDRPAIDRISSLGREMDEKTGAQVVVVTVDSLGDSSIQDYANTLLRAWGLGDKKKNNGVLLLFNKENILSGQPGRVRIEVGYGLEGAITDGMAGRILDNYVLPRFDQQQYSEGVVQGYLAVAAQVAKEYHITLEGNYAPVPAGTPMNTGESLPAPVIGLMIAIIMLAIFAGLTRRRKRYGGRDDDDHGGFGGWGGGGFGGWGGGGFGGWGGGGGGGGGFGGGSSGGGGADR